LWDGADGFGMIEKLLGFIQEGRERWDLVARKQIAEAENEAIQSEEGETEVKGVNKIHSGERDDSE
jgi:hypothetical protein